MNEHKRYITNRKISNMFLHYRNNHQSFITNQVKIKASEIIKIKASTIF